MTEEEQLFGKKDEKPKCPFPVPLDVCHLFEKLALDLWAAGHIQYSARAILHRIRWHFHVDIGNRSFKANNNWTPALSRWFLKLHPEMPDFFNTRASPQTGGEGHNREDYMGPYT